MGKDSLLKSTSKEATGPGKTVAKKEAPAKKRVSAKKKAAGKKAVPAKKAAPAKKTAPQKAAAKKAAPPKAAARKAAPPTLRELISLKFDGWARADGRVPMPPPTSAKGAAPPFFTGADPHDTARMKKLLFEKFDMSAIEAAGRASAEKRAAEEKAAAEKAAAEKAAAEKAAAEKAAAEKAAAEKAAAEKAAAEKAAAEKAAAEKAAAEKVTVTYEAAYDAPGKSAAPVDRSGQLVMFGIFGIIGVVFLLLIGASMNNTGNFYMTSQDGALTVYQGKFAPLGKRHLITLPGVALAEAPRSVYTKQDVYPLIFSFYLTKADSLLKADGFPDFDGIKDYLEKALAVAVTADAKETVYRRIDGIDILLNLYRADVAATRGTAADYREALEYLARAGRLNPDVSQASLIEQKTAAAQVAIAALEAKAAEEAAAVEKAAAEENADEVKNQ